MLIYSKLHSKSCDYLYKFHVLCGLSIAALSHKYAIKNDAWQGYIYYKRIQRPARMNGIYIYIYIYIYRYRYSDRFLTEVQDTRRPYVSNILCLLEALTDKHLDNCRAEGEA